MAKNRQRNKYNRTRDNRRIRGNANTYSQAGNVGRENSPGQCPCCGSALSVDESMPELVFCPVCSMFFIKRLSSGKIRGLEEVLSAVRKISGTDMLFSTRVVGIVACAIPDIEEIRLKILRDLTLPDREDLVDSICNDAELEDIEVSNYVSNTGYSQRYVTEVFNAFRTALGKKTINSANYADDESGRVIQYFECSATEVDPGGKVNIRWKFNGNSRISGVLITASGQSNVKSEGSRWLEVHKDQDIILKVFYKNRLQETRKIGLSVFVPPVINLFYCLPASSVMESERVTVKWDIENANKITLVRRHNDYERLSIDVTDHNGEFSFTAQRTEMLDIVAERGSKSERSSVMLEVQSLPRFDVGRIPDLVFFPKDRIVQFQPIVETKGLTELVGRVAEISSLSGESPYLSLKNSMRQIISLGDKMLRKHFKSQR